MKIEVPICENCKFSWPIGSTGFECRRFPPNANANYRGKGFFPEVTENTWCGEHQRKKEGEW